MLGNLNKKDYKGLVSSNVIPNCPVLHTDITNAQTISGPDLASVRGKTVRRVPAPVVGDYMAVSRELVAANVAVTLAADFFFVDGMAFPVTVSRRMKFITAEHILVRTAESLSKHIERVLLVYG
jgi:hypothetical protein